MSDYNWKKGEFKWRESAKPVYRWAGGFTKRIFVEAKAQVKKRSFFCKRRCFFT